MAPYAGGASTFYRFVARLRAGGEAGAPPVIRFVARRQGSRVGGVSCDMLGTLCSGWSRAP